MFWGIIIIVLILFAGYLLGYALAKRGQGLDVEKYVGDRLFKGVVA